jgi:hypothetical protein
MCAQMNSFSTLCESLHGPSLLAGLPQISPSWPAQLAPHLSSCLLPYTEQSTDSDATGQQEANNHLVRNWTAFTKLCECSEYLPHTVAACTVSELCSAHRRIQPQFGAALSRMLWCAAQQCASCALEAQSCSMFSRSFMDTIAACRCVLIAASTDESGAALQYIQQLFSSQSHATPEMLFNPVSCVASAALLLAASTDVNSGVHHEDAAAEIITQPLQLLAESQACQLTEDACGVLQWALQCRGKQDAAVDSVLQGHVVALLSLVISLAGGWHVARRHSEATRACSRCIPMHLCMAVAQLCGEKQAAVPQVLRATGLLLLVVVCFLIRDSLCSRVLVWICSLWRTGVRT